MQSFSHLCHRHPLPSNQALNVIFDEFADNHSVVFKDLNALQVLIKYLPTFTMKVIEVHVYAISLNILLTFCVVLCVDPSLRSVTKDSMGIEK